MIFNWGEVLPQAIQSLNVKQQEMLSYAMKLPGKKPPVAAHILKTWALTRFEFEAEVQAALSQIRAALTLRGLRNASDLEILP